MGGLFIIKYKSGYIDYMTHEYFFSLDPVVKKEKLAPLRKKYRLKQLEVFCGCGDNVRMVMVYRSDTDSYFLRSADKSAHHKECVYVKGNHNFFDSSNLYQEGYVKQADGFTEIQLDGQDFKIEKKHTPIKAEKAGTTRKSLSSDRTGTSIYRPSIYAVLTRFLHESWNNVIQFSYYKNAPYPNKDKKTVYNHLINRVIRGYKANDIKLRDLLYKGEAEGKIHVIAKKHNFKSAAFTVMLLHNEGILNYSSLK